MNTSLLPILKKAIEKDRVASAYLITGTQEDILSVQALLFAKHLNCEKKTLCNECLPCQKIERGVHPDVTHLKSEGETIKIDVLRNLQKRLYLKANEGRFKIVIIEGASYLQTASSNSILKILEEPPRDTVFLLLTPFSEKMIPTILSRCLLVRMPMKLKSISVPESFIWDFEPYRDPDRLFEFAKEISQNDKMFREYLDGWLAWHHTILYQHQGIESLHTPFPEKATLSKHLSQCLTQDAIYRKIEAIHAAQDSLNYQVNRLLLAEKLLIELAK